MNQLWLIAFYSFYQLGLVDNESQREQGHGHGLLTRVSEALNYLKA